MSSARFSISLHILTLLEKAQGESVTSEYLAGSININPVLVRKELINLKKHGFIVSKEGKGGGVSLAKNPALINLGEIYTSVKPKALLGTHKNTPNPKCPVGREIDKHLNSVFDDAERSLQKSLAVQTLADFSNKFC